MNKPSISLLLPTRGRPALVERLFRSIAETTSQLERVEIILYVDEDDVASHQLDSSDFSVVRIIGPAAAMGSYNTACLEKARGDIIILANDDMVIRTDGWDDLISEMDAEFEDRIYLAYANDLFKKSKFCTFPIMSRRTCELLIDPYPAAYRRAFIDVHLFDIFKRVEHAGFSRIRYLDNLIFEHLHVRAGKAPDDETYSKGRMGRFADDSVFISMMTMRSLAAERLVHVIRDLPPISVMENAAPEFSPTGVVGAVGFFSRQLLFDRDLPFGWRAFLWYWFIGRYLAANGWLKPFVK